MRSGRRQFFCAIGLLPLVGHSHAATRRVVVIGGGWGGLAAARHLRALAPDLEVVLVDRQSGASQALAAAGLRLHAVFTLGGLLDYWERAGSVPPEQIAAARAFLAQ